MLTLFKETIVQHKHKKVKLEVLIEGKPYYGSSKQKQQT